MAISEAQKKARNKWNKENQKRITIVMNNDFYLRIIERLEKTGESKNGFIIQAIREKLDRDTLLEDIQTNDQNEK